MTSPRQSAMPKNGNSPSGSARQAKTSRVTKVTPAKRANGSDDAAPASLVKQAVDILRKRILSQRGSNNFLGSEEELMNALGVSRPTFRQAARLLEHEQLLKIKRGIGGGFFALPPSAEAVTRLASIFLNSQGTTLEHINEACGPLLIEAVRMVARNPDVTVRSQLQEFVDRHRGYEQQDDERLYVRIVLEFEQLLGRLSGNPAVELMINVMRDLVRDPRHGHYRITRERAARYAEFNRRLAEAVRNGDADMAVLIVKRHIDDIRSWLPESGNARKA